jgi:integrase
MERTRSKGIFTDADGTKVVDKVYKGRRITCRLGKISQNEAEEWLNKQLVGLRQAVLFGENPRRTFQDGVLKHFAEEAIRLTKKYGGTPDEPSPKAQEQLDTLAWHMKMLVPVIGPMPLDEVSDDTLKPFVAKRERDGVSPTTIKRSLEVVRVILNKAARKWRENRRPWLTVQPPAITMPRNPNPHTAAPISREEERSIFGRLPLHLARMCQFKVNTGLREQEVCGLRWEWEHVMGNQPSVFVIPPGSHKGGSFHRIVVLNSVARSVIEAVRGMDEHFVFVSPRTKKPLGCLNNNPWQKARRLAGLPFIRIHDLKHTYGERLEAAGVDFEVKQVLLGHKNGSVTSHYSGPRIAALLAAAEKVVTVADSLSIMRVVGGEAKPVKNAKNGLPERAESHPEFTQAKRKGPRTEP